MKNYLWNMFANIKNGQLSRRRFVIQKRKKICEEFLKMLWDEGLINGYLINQDNNNQMKIILKYTNNKPAINNIRSITKPGRRVYYSIKQIWKISSSKSFIIISTNKGLKSLTECKKLGIGGEPYVIVN